MVYEEELIPRKLCIDIEENLLELTRDEQIAVLHDQLTRIFEQSQLFFTSVQHSETKQLRVCKINVHLADNIVIIAGSYNYIDVPNNANIVSVYLQMPTGWVEQKRCNITLTGFYYHFLYRLYDYYFKTLVQHQDKEQEDDEEDEAMAYFQ